MSQIFSYDGDDNGFFNFMENIIKKGDEAFGNRKNDTIYCRGLLLKCFIKTMLLFGRFKFFGRHFDFCFLPYENGKISDVRFDFLRMSNSGPRKEKFDFFIENCLSDDILFDKECEFYVDFSFRINDIKINDFFRSGEYFFENVKSLSKDISHKAYSPIRIRLFFKYDKSENGSIFTKLSASFWFNKKITDCFKSFIEEYKTLIDASKVKFDFNNETDVLQIMCIGDVNQNMMYYVTCIYQVVNIIIFDCFRKFSNITVNENASEKAEGHNLSMTTGLDFYDLDSKAEDLFSLLHTKKGLEDNLFYGEGYNTFQKCIDDMKHNYQIYNTVKYIKDGSINPIVLKEDVNFISNFSEKNVESILDVDQDVTIEKTISNTIKINHKMDDDCRITLSINDGEGDSKVVFKTDITNIKNKLIFNKYYLLCWLRNIIVSHSDNNKYGDIFYDQTHFEWKSSALFSSISFSISINEKGGCILDFSFQKDGISNVVFAGDFNPFKNLGNSHVQNVRTTDSTNIKIFILILGKDNFNKLKFILVNKLHKMMEFSNFFENIHDKTIQDNFVYKQMSFGFKDNKEDPDGFKKAIENDFMKRDKAGGNICKKCCSFVI